jgi:putative hydrolase of the HAD superfamily
MPKIYRTDAGLGVSSESTSPGEKARGAVGVVFDGDDTLWSTEPLYDQARSEARRIVVECGLDGAQWESLERRIDVENVATFGYSTERFPTSCVQAYEAVMRAEVRTPNPAVAQMIREAARSVFERDPPLLPGARETLARLRSCHARLALLTKGDHELQLRRIERSGLADLFDVIEVVSEKSADTIRHVVATLGVDLDSAWMVGNSMRSDVLPALEAGLRAIWIDAHVWEYERAHDHLVDDRIVIASALPDILTVIQE